MNQTEYQVLTAQQKYAHTFERASTTLINRGFEVTKLTKNPQKVYFVVKHTDGSVFCNVLIKIDCVLRKACWSWILCLL
jgi:predicted GNAT superfamily acetyltransferase